MELLKCGQCGDRPGLLVTVTDRAADTSINLRYECYKMYARAIERALKAEALARELVKVLKHIERLTEMVWQGVGPVTTEIRLAAEGALEKAKEVLGDEN